MSLDIVAQDRKLRAVIAQFRQAALVALTADASVTYTECADAVEAAIAAKILTAICEGCGLKTPMPTKHAGKIYPDLPHDWSESGVSKHKQRGHGVRLAAWCPNCRSQPVSRRRRGRRG